MSTRSFFGHRPGFEDLPKGYVVTRPNTDSIALKLFKVTAFLMSVGLLVSVSASPSGFSAKPAPDGPPFSPGERLTYHLRWGIVPVGEAVLEVKPLTTLDGISAYHFSVQARSNAFVDIFYKVRDHIDAFADAEMTRSVHYRQKQQEGSTRRDVTVHFDWEKKEVQHVNFGEKRPPISIQAGTFDPLSVFYFARLKAMKPGVVIEKWVTDGKRCVIGKGTVVRREKIQLGKKSVDTVLFEPECKEVRGVFEQSPGAKIEVWLTDDAHRIPVKIKSKVIVGSFVGELVSAEGVAASGLK